MIFQDFHLFAGMTAEQNVLIAGTFEHLMVPGALRDRARMLLTRVGLPGGLQRVETLSRGEMQRVAVARALLFSPPVVLADEPTASLDEENGARVMELLCELCGEGGSTLLVVTHDPRLLARLPVVHTLVAGRLAASRAVEVRTC
jgi:putative ABC transport system ATP-binding protein